VDLKRLQPLTSQTFLSATQIWVWRTPGDPSFKKYWKCEWFLAASC